MFGLILTIISVILFYIIYKLLNRSIHKKAETIKNQVKDPAKELESTRLKRECEAQQVLVNKLLHEWADLAFSRNTVDCFNRDRTTIDILIEEADNKHNDEKFKLKDLLEDYDRAIARELNGDDAAEYVPTESDVIEKEYREQRRICNRSLTRWSNLYNKTEHKRGTLREITEAELVIDDACKQKDRDEAKLTELKKKFKAAIAKEKAKSS